MDDKSEVPYIKSDNHCTGINVEASIQKLQELAYQTIKSNGCIDHNQIQEFQSLTENIAELEDERNALHDALEIETINASKKRHALQVLPPIYRKELEEAVLAARQANEEDIRSMKRTLDEQEAERDEKEKTHMRLMKENKRLGPESDVIRREHDEIIAQLNQRMSDKANKQIVLNESRDALRDTKQQTSEIDIGIENVSEDLADDLKVMAEAKTALLGEITETEDLIKVQKEKNAEEKKITDKILDQIMEVGAKLDDEQKTVRRIENSHSRLEMQVLQLQNKIEREKKSNQELFNENEVKRAVKCKQQLEYEQQVAEIEKKLQVVLGQMEEAQQAQNEISAVKKEVYGKQKEATIKKIEIQTQAKSLASEVENLKKQTTEQIEIAANFTQSNAAVREKVELLNENHLATVETYNTQIEEYETVFIQERQERQKTEEMRDESEKVLENFSAEQIKYMNEMTRNIELCRDQHRELTDKSIWLNKETKSNLDYTNSLGIKIEVAEGSFRTMKASLEMAIVRLKSSVELLRSDNERKTQYLKEKGPEMIELGVELDSRTEEYSALKEDVIAVRNKEKSVKEQITRVHVIHDKLLNPIKQLKESLRAVRREDVEKMAQQGVERKEMEEDIYHTTLKLEQVVNSNDGFREGIQTTIDELEQLHSEMKSNKRYQLKLFVQLEILQKQFSDAWENCIGMEKASADQDQDILTGIGRVQKETFERSKVLNKISSDLQQELSTLTGFLDDVSKRRPKDTRQSKRQLAKDDGQTRQSDAAMTTKHSQSGLGKRSSRNMPRADRSDSSLRQKTSSNLAKNASRLSRQSLAKTSSKSLRKVSLNGEKSGENLRGQSEEFNGNIQVLPPVASNRAMAIGQ